jgi:hypothetical protein
MLFLCFASESDNFPFFPDQLTHIRKQKDRTHPNDVIAQHSSLSDEVLKSV